MRNTHQMQLKTLVYPDAVDEHTELCNEFRISMYECMLSVLWMHVSEAYYFIPPVFSPQQTYRV